MKLKQSQENLLTQLAHFKYLNSHHMIRLWIVGHKDNLYSWVFKGIREPTKQQRDKEKVAIEKAISAGKKPPKRPHNNILIRCQRPAKTIAHGQRPDVYYLTKKWVSWLVDHFVLEEDEIRYPVANTSVATSDYNHRMATIDIHISLKIWLDSVWGEIISVSSYFDKPWSQRRGEPEILNKIPLGYGNYVYPDLITHFCVNEQEKIIVWEQHNGKDTKKLIGQVANHIKALEARAVGQNLGLNKLHRVALVFEHESIMKRSMTRLKEIYWLDDDVYKFFIFKTNAQLDSEAYSDWFLWNGEYTTML